MLLHWEPRILDGSKYHEDFKNDIMV